MSALLGFLFVLAMIVGICSWVGDLINRIKRHWRRA